MMATKPITFNTDNIIYRIGSKMLIPHTNFILSEDVNDLPIKGITVGPMPHQELARRDFH